MRGRDAGHTTRAYPGPGRLAHWLPALLVLVLLAAGVLAHRLDWGPRHLGWGGPDPASDPGAVAPPPGLELPDVPAPAPVAEPVPASAGGTVDPALVAAAIGRGLDDKDLGRHVVALVGDLAGGAPAYARGGDPVIPASTTKLLTATAALEVLGPEATFRTRVVTGRRPRDLVLVGGGDPYLASRPAEEPTWPERADVRTLAARTATALASLDEPVTRVRLGYDASLFTGSGDNPHWRRSYVREDIVSPIGALWVDGGQDPSGWGRVDDPARVAAEAYAAALRTHGVRVVGTPQERVADPGATELAAVESAPLGQLVQRALDVSDNEATEVIAHHVGLATAGVGSFEAGAEGVLRVLSALGVDTSGDRVHDGSGLSRDNRISPATLLAVLRLAASEDHPQLRAVVQGLPVAGFTGSLTWRFEEGPPEGRGRVRAKTGTLTGVHSLAGITTDLDGNAMAFVLAADRVRADRSLAARDALDAVAASLAACRCSAVAGSVG